MIHSTSSHHSSHPNFRYALCLVFLLSLTVFAEKKQKNDEATIYQGGVRASSGDRELTPKQLKTVLTALASKTGYQELTFDEKGFLSLGNRENFKLGSGTARRLLLAAVDGPVQLTLEDHSKSKTVSFSRINAGVQHQRMTTREKIEVRPILIDFSDFDYLSGDRDVLAAFDLGIVLLHELVHGVYQLPDVTETDDEIGECESYINAIRHDLGLPERDRYTARSFNVTLPLGLPVKMATLPFTRTVTKKGQSKTETAYLLWNTDRVGLVPAQSVTASVAGKKDATKSAASVQ